MDILLSWTYKCVEVGGGGGKRTGGGASGSPKFTIIFKGKQSKHHAQSHSSQLEFKRGFYVTNFLTLKSASSRGMKVCTNSSGPILVSRS